MVKKFVVPLSDNSIWIQIQTPTPLELNDHPLYYSVKFLNNVDLVYCMNKKAETESKESKN